ncbi:MAG: hypothetical protein JJT89_05955 [Nitriliruptoraceae bacterium]|nr:hypothetical protein [Nitriliruptoraceae bacterium]
MSPYTLHLLGGFEVVGDRGSIQLPPSTRRLVAALALERARLSRSRLAERLWPAASADHAAGTLRTALWRLRRCADGLVEVDASGLLLSTSTAVDLWHLVDSLTPTGDQHLEVELRAELLPGWDDDWVPVERERVRQVQLHLLEQRADAHRLAGEHDRAVLTALAAVSSDPLRESAHRTLILAYLGEGNRVDAWKSYGRYRDVLATELGLPPSPALTGLIRAACDGEVPAAPDVGRSSPPRLVIRAPERCPTCQRSASPLVPPSVVQPSLIPSSLAPSPVVASDSSSTLSRAPSRRRQ